MDILKRADQIALKAIRKNDRNILRFPTVGTEQSKDVCLDQLVALLREALTVDEMAKFAAEAIYRANFFEQRAAASVKRTARMLSDLEEAESGTEGDARTSRSALAGINEHGHPLISKAIAHGRSIETKLKGSTGGQVRAAKIAGVEAFAVELFQQKKWPSARQAAKALSEQVQAKAKMLGWTMSADQAEKTISEWFGPKKMRARQAAKVPR